MKIYITGTSGFIGSNLVKKLLKEKEYKIYSAEADITEQYQVLKEIKEINPDIIIHCAAVVSSPWAQLADWYSYDVNVKGTYNIVIASKKVNAKFIYCSTTSIYKPTDKLITEESEIKPTTLYNFTKWLGELVVQHELDNYLILRLCHIYGPYKDHCSLIMETIKNSINGFPVILTSAPNSKRSYLYIDDLIEAFKLAIEKDLNGIYNIASQQYFELKTIINKVVVELEIKGYKPILVWRPELDYLKNHCVSPKKFISKTGWEEKTLLIEGIRKCIELELSKI